MRSNIILMSKSRDYMFYSSYVATKCPSAYANDGIFLKYYSKSTFFKSYSQLTFSTPLLLGNTVYILNSQHRQQCVDNLWSLSSIILHSPSLLLLLLPISLLVVSIQWVLLQLLARPSPSSFSSETPLLLGLASPAWGPGCVMWAWCRCLRRCTWSWAIRSCHLWRPVLIDRFILRCIVDCSLSWARWLRKGRVDTVQAGPAPQIIRYLVVVLVVRHTYDWIPMELEISSISCEMKPKPLAL